MCDMWHVCVCGMCVCVACVCVWHVCVCGMCVCVCGMCVCVWHVCVCVCVFVHILCHLSKRVIWETYAPFSPLHRLWDIRQLGAPLHLLMGHGQAVRRVRASPHDPNIIASCSYDFTVR